jgi:hypothetical protein
MEDESVHPVEIGDDEAMGKIVGLGLKEEGFGLVISIRSYPDAKGLHSFPRFLSLDDHVDRDATFGEGNGSRGRDGGDHGWTVFRPFPVY